MLNIIMNTETKHIVNVKLCGLNSSLNLEEDKVGLIPNKELQRYISHQKELLQKRFLNKKLDPLHMEFSSSLQNNNANISICSNSVYIIVEKI